LSRRRGAGLWLWKPYLINRTLATMEEGALLMYSDAVTSEIELVSTFLSRARLGCGFLSKLLGPPGV